MASLWRICSGQILHGSAATTDAIRHALQNCQDCLRALSSSHGFSHEIVAKWKKRSSTADLPTGLRETRSTVLSNQVEAVNVTLRKITLLLLDDCQHALQHLAEFFNAYKFKRRFKALKSSMANRRFRNWSEAEITIQMETTNLKLQTAPP